jgi:hypothetical protein
MQDKASEGTKTLAVLIDADNISAAAIEQMLAKISVLGYACVKRMYGDWTSPNLSSWKKIMRKHGLQPIQQFAYTSGKNSTDGAMMIDAMDLMYTQRFDGFCICSSDSDFTRLAMRLREQGLLVYGFGETKTPVSFTSACTEFVYLETAAAKAQSSLKAPVSKSSPPVPDVSRPEVELGNTARRALHISLQRLSDKTGWCSAAILGNQVKAKDYGHKKLLNLIKVFPHNFEVEWRDMGDPVNPTLFVRIKQSNQNELTQNILH